MELAERSTGQFPATRHEGAQVSGRAVAEERQCGGRGSRDPTEHVRVEPAGEHDTRVRIAPRRGRGPSAPRQRRGAAPRDAAEAEEHHVRHGHARTARASSTDATRADLRQPAQRRREVVGETVIIPTASAWSMGRSLQHADRRADHLHLIAQVVASLGLLERVGANLGHSGLERLHIGAQVFRGGLARTRSLAQRGDLAPRLFVLGLALGARRGVLRGDGVETLQHAPEAQEHRRHRDQRACMTATHVGSAITTAPRQWALDAHEGAAGHEGRARVAHEHTRTQSQSAAAVTVARKPVRTDTALPRLQAPRVALRLGVDAHVGDETDPAFVAVVRADVPGATVRPASSRPSS